MSQEAFHKNKKWAKTARGRRLAFLALLFIPTAAACGLMSRTLSHEGVPALEFSLAALFAVLYIWILFGFWTGVAGFYSLMHGCGRYSSLASGAAEGTVKIPEHVRTAILIPVRNEKVDRIFAGLYSVCRSLERTRYADRFDFFVLSDTDDPDKWIEEEAAWDGLRKRPGQPSGSGIFYRNRRVNLKRKSGNIADFCRRWGANYRYMAVFDADSIMTGPALVRLVAAMEENPAVGILQTSPRAVNAKTLFARILQFADHLYGPMFSAGLHFWQLGDAQYWGHNAIIRVEPFMRHCALPVLPGRPPLGGYILSHDFVEAALMRRAGWEVWLAHGLPGSYEELPPVLPGDLGRDRRWCQGNLQHLRLFFTKGIVPAHRFLFFAGAMNYISGLVWFLFLAAGTAQAFSQAFILHVYFPSRYALFPNWPLWRKEEAITLLALTAFLLLLPKLLSVLAVAARRGARAFGGISRLLAGVAAEIIFSALLAPIRMISHSRFVILTMLGRKVKWDPQEREGRAVSWSGALRLHGAATVFGLAWGASALLISPSFFWWLTPILFALVLSMPLSVWSSRQTAGGKFRNLGLFLTEEEITPSLEQRWMESYLREYRTKNPAPLAIGREKGFIRAVADPEVNALHLSLLRKGRRYCRSIMKKRNELRNKALLLGPERLAPSEKKELLLDPFSMTALHDAVWKNPDGVPWGIL